MYNINKLHPTKAGGHYGLTFGVLHRGCCDAGIYQCSTPEQRGIEDSCERAGAGRNNKRMANNNVTRASAFRCYIQPCRGWLLVFLPGYVSGEWGIHSARPNRKRFACAINRRWHGNQVSKPWHEKLDVHSIRLKGAAA